MAVLPATVFSIAVTWLVFAATSEAFPGKEPVILKEYQGTIKGTLRVVMDLEIWDDGVISGGYYYRKNMITIPVTGRFDKDLKFELEERAPVKGREEVTGQFRGTFTKNFDKLQGIWSNGRGTKSFPFSMVASGRRTEGKKGTGIDAYILRLPITSADKRSILNELLGESAQVDNNDESSDEFTEHSVEYSSPALLSVLTTSQYRGAHLNTGYTTRNYLIRGNHATKLSLSDLFTPGSDYRKVVSDLCIAELRRQNAGFDSEPLEELEAFVITGKGLVFYFGTNIIGGDQIDGHSVVIPYKKLSPIIKPNGPLFEFFGKNRLPGILKKEQN